MEKKMRAKGKGLLESRLLSAEGPWEANVAHIFSVVIDYANFPWS